MVKRKRKIVGRNPHKRGGSSKLRGISHVTNDNILCSDSWKSYKTYAKEKGLKVLPINT